MVFRHCLLWKLLDQTIFFQQHNKHSDWNEIEIPYEHGIKIISPRRASPQLNAAYFGNSLGHVLSSWWQQLLEKIYDLWCQNGAMVSDSFANRKTKSCKQQGLGVLRLKF